MSAARYQRQKPLDNQCYDDDVLHTWIPSSSTSSESSYSSNQLQQKGCQSDTEQLVAELSQLGFDAAFGFVRQYGPQRVRAAMERARSQSRGTIRNLPGYIRHLVANPGPIARPQKQPDPADKFTSGKYGHVVRR